MTLKTIFLGTPALAVPFLEVLAEKTNVLEVITNPDQPAGRGYEVREPPVKQAAARLGLPVRQPATLKDPAALAPFQALQPDLAVVVAYGKLLPKPILETAKQGFLNVHFSLLPAYRGAAPIQWALINGERETGVTLFWLDEGMDTGPIFLQKKRAVEDQDAESLRRNLVASGVAALQEAISLIEAGQIRRQPQTGEPSRAPLLKKEDGHIDWQQPDGRILNLIRGTTPWPGAYGQLHQHEKSTTLKIIRAEVVAESAEGAAGSIVRVDSGAGFIVKCGQNSLRITQVQPEGKKAMPAWDFWQGARLKPGDQLR